MLYNYSSSDKLEPEDLGCISLQNLNEKVKSDKTVGRKKTGGKKTLIGDRQTEDGRESCSLFVL